MLWWFISTFMLACSKILWKKSLDFEAHHLVKSLMSYIPWITLVLWLIIAWIIHIETDVYFLIYSIFFVLLNIWVNKLEQEVYENEHISKLAPYENLDKIFVLFASFFIIKDVSLEAFLITVLTIIIIWAFSIEKNLSIPENIKKLLLCKILKAFSLLIVAYLIKNFSDTAVLISNALIWCSITFILIITNKVFYQIPKLERKFVWYRISAWIFWWTWYALSLFLISEVWISIATLLSFIWIWFTLFLSKIFLWDEVKKKDLLLTFIVLSLVSLWFYLK